PYLSPLARVDPVAGRIGGAEVDADEIASGHARSAGANVELELPAPPVARHTPDGERPHLGDLCLEAHADGAALVTGLAQGRLERRQLLELALVPALDHRSRNVAGPHRRAEEAEGGGLADHEAELHVGQRRLAPLLHPERRHAQGLHRRGPSPPRPPRPPPPRRASAAPPPPRGPP